MVLVTVLVFTDLELELGGLAIRALEEALPPPRPPLLAEIRVEVAPTKSGWDWDASAASAASAVKMLERRSTPAAAALPATFP